MTARPYQAIGHPGRLSNDRYLEILADHMDESASSNLIIGCQRLEGYKEALARLDYFAANTRSANLLVLKADQINACRDFGKTQTTHQSVYYSPLKNTFSIAADPLRLYWDRYPLLPLPPFVHSAKSH